MIEPSRGERAAREARMREKERAQRAVSQTFKPPGQRAAREARQNRVCEYHRPVIEKQRDLSYPHQLRASEAEFCRFIAGRFRQALVQQYDGERTERLQPRGQ